MNPAHRCGTVALIGRPNVGKSTLLNRFLGQKIAIVSPKPETTRDRLLGILTLADAQILFLDTPGIYRGAKTLMAKHQVGQAREALEAADVLLLMTEAHVGVTDGDREIIPLLPRKEETPVFLAINKVDRIERKLVLPQIEAFSQIYPFREIFPISAKKGTTAQPLLEALKKALPEGPALYPSDQVTDRPVRELAGELIREKTLIFTHEEIPHAVAVMIEEWRSGQPSSRGPNPATAAPTTYIRATLYLERESQKGILIGKEGGLLKRIGQTARLEIEKLLEGPVFLDLWVKVAPNWRKNPRDLKRFGYG
ncbi:MAG: GTPase Era [Candidatus Omnitrophica bacterium]|nr:GTPase Era [Candidatus Omnitrophota bacterium]